MIYTLVATVPYTKIITFNIIINTVNDIRIGVVAHIIILCDTMYIIIIICDGSTYHTHTSS